MDRSISSHGNDHIIALFSSLLRQLNGMTRIDCATPIYASVLFCDGTQVTCHAPGISHICHRVEDNFDFAMHAGFSIRETLKVFLLSEAICAREYCRFGRGFGRETFRVGEL